MSPRIIGPARRPQVVLVVGVNGSGCPVVARAPGADAAGPAYDPRIKMG